MAKKKRKQQKKNSLVKKFSRNKLTYLALILVCLGVGALGTYMQHRSKAATFSNVQPGMDADLTWGTGKRDIKKTVSLMQQVGVKWTRAGCDWASVERTKGSYSWGACDAGIKAAKDAGINVLVNLVNAPGWAQSGYQNTSYPPTADHYGDFAAFAAAATAHFKPMGVQHYEIWNEQNISRFWPASDTNTMARQYVQMLQPAYRAIKATDPGAQVLFGGTARSDIGYIEAAYNNGAKGYFDIMATHPYPDPLTRPPEHGVQSDMGSFLAYRQVHQNMINRGDNKPIWLTEFGWSTCSNGGQCVSEQAQADYTRRAYSIINKDTYVQVAFLYNFRNNYWANNGDNWDDSLGIMKVDYSAKPAFSVYKDLFTAGVGWSNPAPAPAPIPVTKVPLKMYWNAGNTDHYYTVGNWTNGYGGYYFYENTGYVFPTQQPGTVPLKEYWNGGNSDHYYTIGNWTNGYGGYYFTQNQGFVYPTQQPGTVPLKEYWNAQLGDHFYTIGNWTSGYGGYYYTQTQGYVYPSP